jgi:cell division protein FtsI (penicillin-binding protein 3)
MALADDFGDKSAASYKRDLNTGLQENERYYPLRKKLSFEDYKNVVDNFPLQNWEEIKVV